ncbi:DNA-methyltransferase [Collimonas silvisoli]|uniref:DNA-methyltransferase n=1 Tax=Collimonas silvisoli TaxID=2825884 RepID=UPI001B8C01A5|nr:site-specific DNA-methyltransferase [Collimonas silvisoli]
MTELALMHGDCMTLLKSVPDASVQLILADLPYGTTRNKWDSVLPLPELWPHYLRICTGAIVLTAQTPFDKVLGCSNLKMLRYEWIWEKTSATGHMNARRAPMKAHENVLVFYRSMPTYNPIKTFGHTRKSATADRTRHQSSNYGRQAGTSSYDSTERFPRSVLRFASDKQRESIHPTQKPVALMEYFVKTYSNPGDTVLDNCMGSGSTGVACVRTERSFVGIERDCEMFTRARERILRVQAETIAKTMEPT